MYDLQVLGSKAERESMRLQNLSHAGNGNNGAQEGTDDEDDNVKKPLLPKAEATTPSDDTAAGEAEADVPFKRVFAYQRPDMGMVSRSGGRMAVAVAVYCYLHLVRRLHSRRLSLVCRCVRQFVTSVIGATFNGCVIPAFSIVFSNMISLFGDTRDTDKMKHDSLEYLVGFLIIAVVSFVVRVPGAWSCMCTLYLLWRVVVTVLTRGYFGPAPQALFIQMYGATYVGERLTRRLRSDVFDAVMKQEVRLFTINANTGPVPYGHCTVRLACAVDRSGTLTWMRTAPDG